MKDANHALDILGRKLGLANLGFDDQGLVGLSLAEGVTFHLTRIDDAELEVSTPIQCLDFPDAALLRAMVEGHYLGAAVGAGRLAVDPDSDRVILCERWVIADMEAPVLERRFEDFAANAVFLMSEGGEALLERAETIRLENLPAGGDFAPDDMQEGEDGDPPIVMRL